ncbi:ThuA domain-containing protein [Paenibacillus validus]|uniref:Trehalose utilization protein ThuA n=1 Tax=Paenibacillus validus TaxID=44253 RepID=A0A7X3CUZ2_9BACL|nr:MULTISPECIES: ThuA domain-containing protein [Paenibacillus]MED4600917.1 ThuA domain-containing protein [Paenibacillus validus]MED4608785.1 ThuA domain-containing protein [Paenibacillus validus]MUG73196.1 trehalose utilization protein ThuA [Paenibacillus validus]
MGQKLRVTVWNEFRHEKESERIRSVYPQGIHTAIGEGLGADVEVAYATLDDPEHGLSEERLNSTDVLIWWGHKAHDQVQDAIVDRVQQRVLQGMGLIVLHSGHFSKVFKRLMGTGCDLKWREADEKERIWVVAPNHPIVEGIGEYIELPEEEMYGEHFDIPAPDELVMVSWFEGGEVFRSGCTFHRGQGKIFYFRPGHEAYPTYYNEQIRRVIRNAAYWAAPTTREYPTYGNHKPLETIKAKG